MMSNEYTTQTFEYILFNNTDHIQFEFILIIYINTYLINYINNNILKVLRQHTIINRLTYLVI